MPLSPAGSQLYAQLFGDEETAGLLSDRAEVEAMLEVEAALAEAQGTVGVIPAESAAFLSRACRGLVLDPASLADQTATDGVPVPALVAAVRRALAAPEHTQYLHWGATSQDIVDTALVLRLKQVLDLWEARLGQLAATLGDLAEAQADTPLAARTYGQVAVPTSFGGTVARWGRPLLRYRERLVRVREEVLAVSLGGAAGTLAAMDGKGPDVRAALARRLGLGDPGQSWHAERDGIGALAAWMAGCLGSLGKMGEDLILLAQSGIGEIRIRGSGGSSTMPQKENPVGPSVLVALARTGIGIAGVLRSAALHRQDRDGAAWFTEWMTLPQLCALTGRALSLAADLAHRIEPDASAMSRNLEAQAGTVHAEALSFALARLMPRSEAQSEIKRLAVEAQRSGISLPDLVRREYPSVDWSGPSLGTAPTEARTFAKEARSEGASSS